MKQGADRSHAMPASARALRRASDRSIAIPLWWRDDDAGEPSPALDRLLELRRRHGVPLALAVIPARATASLARRLDEEDDVCVLQHGLRHANHAPPGEKRAEYGDHRPGPVMEAEIAGGRDRLSELVPDHFRRVFVPPWNRIGTTASALLAPLGLPVLSTFGPARRPGTVNTHCDIMDWHPARGRAIEEIDRCLASEIDWRIARVDADVDPASVTGRPAAVPPPDPFGRPSSGIVAREDDRARGLWQDAAYRRIGPAIEPIGLLTHHLQHDETAWDVLSTLLAVLCQDTATTWPDADHLFAAAS